jgi:hypothetical protein
MSFLLLLEEKEAKPHERNQATPAFSLALQALEGPIQPLARAAMPACSARQSGVGHAQL